jgi:hypothetical protein
MGTIQKTYIRYHERRNVIMRVTVVRQGPYKSWYPGKIVYEAKDDNDAFKFIQDNLDKYNHLYIDYVRKEKKDGNRQDS